MQALHNRDWKDQRPEPGSGINATRRYENVRSIEAFTVWDSFVHEEDDGSALEGVDEGEDEYGNSRKAPRNDHNSPELGQCGEDAVI